MDYKLLSVSKELPEINIGDYVQALASSQFYPKMDGFIERDELSLYAGEECKVIMNGWYMAKPENWPPSDKIKPLFVAFHINSKVKDVMLKPESLEYLKKYEPIGCRDTNTRDMLLENGVDAYFSGCMTLTLGKKYQSDKKNGTVYFVDPYFVTKWNKRSIIKGVMYLAFHFLPIVKIAKKYPEKKSFFRKCMILTGFYREYIKFFSKKVLTDAEYICQQDSYYREAFSNDYERLHEAERLVRKYAHARLVVTSRIHCALPCLGMDTPVIYTENAEQSDASACRFGGLRDLFNIFQWKEGTIKPLFPWNAKVTSGSFSDLPRNKDNWKDLSVQLIDRCERFVTE